MTIFADFNTKALDALNDHGHFVSHVLAHKNVELVFRTGNSSNVYLLMHGSVQLIKNTNNVVVTEITGPYLLGVGNIMSGNDHDMYKVKCLTNCELVKVNKKDLLKVIEEDCQWEGLLLYMEDFLSKIECYYDSTCGDKVYDIVRKNLMIIWRMPEQLRNKISIYDYILSRNKISRSSLQKIVHELNAGDYIKCHRGRLLSVNKLPQMY